uniref:Uncharacterized protein n=2 Tax=Lygus hesperus TaxID=30085 RepID=A0A146MCU8_LYGHE
MSVATTEAVVADYPQSSHPHSILNSISARDGGVLRSALASGESPSNSIHRRCVLALFCCLVYHSNVIPQDRGMQLLLQRWLQFASTMYRRSLVHPSQPHLQIRHNCDIYSLAIEAAFVAHTAPGAASRYHLPCNFQTIRSQVVTLQQVLTTILAFRDLYFTSIRGSCMAALLTHASLPSSHAVVVRTARWVQLAVWKSLYHAVALGAYNTDVYSDLWLHILRMFPHGISEHRSSL